MNGPSPIELALRYQPVCDYFLLDTNDPDRIDVGATGQTHDWNISAELVRRVNIPVILAGGLSPQTTSQSQFAPSDPGASTRSRAPTLKDDMTGKIRRRSEPLLQMPRAHYDAKARAYDRRC